jgi:nitric oxide synthase-interacting protein
MGKHAKNVHAWPTFRPSERKKLKGIWGTHQVRVGANAAKDFDACGICINLASNPLVCPKGHVFCKACIYECLMAQKDHKKKQLKKFEEQLQEAKDDKNKDDKEAKLKEIEMFQKFEAGILPPQDNLFGNKVKMDSVPAGYEAYQTADGKVFIVDKALIKTHSVSSDAMSEEMKEARKKYLPCYWIPSLTPDVGKKKLVTKPTGHTICPSSQHTLRVKHLHPVHFTPAQNSVGSSSSSSNSKNSSSSSSSNSSNNSSNSSSKESKESKDNKAKAQENVNSRWMCPSCRNGLTNATKMACLAKCGHVLCMPCVQTLVLKDGACINCGKDCREKDIIPLELGGTGFSATQKVESVKQLTPAFQG